MTDQTIRSLMHRRRRELADRIAAVESELGPLKRELAEIDRMAAANTVAGRALATNPLTGGGFGAADAIIGRGLGTAENALVVRHLPAAENALDIGAGGSGAQGFR